MSKSDLIVSRWSRYVRVAAKGLTYFFLLTITTAFQPKITVYHPPDSEDGKRLVSLYSDEFSNYTNRIHRQLTYPLGCDTLNGQVLAHALRGYIYLKQTQQLTNPQYLTVIDFSQDCNDKRMWVIDLDTKHVVFNEWVAHGARTGDRYAKYFSNRHSSKQSSLGFYTTGGLYQGRNKLSLKLNGLEKNFNHNAFARGIVIHGANYISEAIVNRNERIGRSFGCPAVRQEINEILVNTIQGGTCLFIWHPTPSYLEKSQLLNANIYVTVDDLSS